LCNKFIEIKFSVGCENVWFGQVADYENTQTAPIDSNSSIDWLKEVQMVEILSYRH
jgi:hypothetical protein